MAPCFDCAVNLSLLLSPKTNGNLSRRSLMWDCLDGPFLFSPRLSRSPPFALFSVRLNEDRLYEQTKKNLHLLLVLTLLSVQRRLFVLAVCLVSLNIESAALRTLWRRRRLRKHLMQRCWSKAWIRFMKCILINHFKTANVALVLGTFFFPSIIFFLGHANPAASLRRRCTSPSALRWRL